MRDLMTAVRTIGVSVTHDFAGALEASFRRGLCSVVTSHDGIDLRWQ
jgi:hypothetical protein